MTAKQVQSSNLPLTINCPRHKSWHSSHPIEKFHCNFPPQNGAQNFSIFSDINHRVSSFFPEPRRPRRANRSPSIQQQSRPSIRKTISDDLWIDTIFICHFHENSFSSPSRHSIFAITRWHTRERQQKGTEKSHFVFAPQRHPHQLSSAEKRSLSQICYLVLISSHLRDGGEHDEKGKTVFLAPHECAWVNE